MTCKRINLFIGEPNVGKSNILEGLSLYSVPVTSDFRKLIRFQDLSNLFFENEPSNEIIVQTEKGTVSVVYDFPGNQVVLNFPNQFQARFSIDGNIVSTNNIMPSDLGIHPYFFRTTEKFSNKRIDFLSPPDGDNLFSILQSNRKLKLLISDFIQDRGFKLTFRQATSEIEISKEQNSILTTYPYHVISDTLQRIIFYVTAIESNHPGTSLILEEPESNVFPYYTKYLAEKIAGDSEKQYFITTHNPYFLQAIIEKVPSPDLTVNLATMNDYQTMVKQLPESAREEILTLNSDVFLNFDKLIET